MTPCQQLETLIKVDKKFCYNQVVAYQKKVPGTQLSCVWCQADPCVTLSILVNHQWNDKDCPNFVVLELSRYTQLWAASIVPVLLSVAHTGPTMESC
jgi:hypothetical protein